MFGEHASEAEDATTAVRLDTVDASEMITFDTGDGVVCCQSLVQKRVVGVDQLPDRTIGSKKILEEGDRFFVGGAAKTFVERWKEFLVFGLELVEAADLEPLSTKLNGQRTDVRML